MKKHQCIGIGELGPLAFNNGDQNLKTVFSFYPMLILSVMITAVK